MVIQHVLEFVTVVGIASAVALFVLVVLSCVKETRGCK